MDAKRREYAARLSREAERLLMAGHSEAAAALWDDCADMARRLAAARHPAYSPEEEGR